jgi:hypothetical protein
MANTIPKEGIAIKLRCNDYLANAGIPLGYDIKRWFDLSVEDDLSFDDLVKFLSRKSKRDRAMFFEHFGLSIIELLDAVIEKAMNND